MLIVYTQAIRMHLLEVNNISGDRYFWLQYAYDWKGYWAYSATQMYGTSSAEHNAKNFIVILENPAENK